MTTRSVRILGIAAIALQMFAPGGRITAGTFVAQPPVYNNSVTISTFTTRIVGQAVYQGTPDANDLNALIQTRENDSRPNQTDGGGANYFGPFTTNQVMNCTSNSCMGWAAITRPFCTSEPPITYSGRNGSFIYHQSGIEISTYTGYSYHVPCKPDGPPPPHCFAESIGRLSVAPVEGAVQLSAVRPIEHYRPSRIEADPHMSYLMDDWAVVAVEVGRDAAVSSIDVAASSSADFGRAVLDGWFAPEGALSDLKATNQRTSTRLDGRLPEGRSVALVVGGPVHPRNSRWIPTPALKLDSKAVSEAEGTAVVRVQAEHGGEPSSFEVIWSSRELSGREMTELESGLRFEYASDDMVHRVVGFGIVRLDGESFALKRGVVVVPECCCGGETCL